MIDLVTLRFPVFVGSDAPRTSARVSIARQARGDTGSFDYAVSIDGERRGRFYDDGGLYRLQDVTGRNVQGVAVSIGPREFEPAVIAALRLGRLPTLAEAVSRVPGDPAADRERIASAVRVLDAYAFVELAGAPDELLVSEGDGISVGLIRSLLDGYTLCRKALTVSI